MHTNAESMPAIKKQARIAGAWYFAVLLIAPIGLVYVPNQLYVRENATATADHIRASETLLRIGTSSELIHEVLWVFVVLALYRLLKPVNENRAREMLILGALVSVPIVFLNVLNEVAALLLVSGANFLAVFTRPQLDALALLFLAGAGYVVSAFTTLLLPQYARPVETVAGILEYGELPIILWLLIWGARQKL